MLMLLFTTDWVSSLGQHLLHAVFYNKLVRAFPELSCTNEQDLLVSLKGCGFAFFLLVVGSLGVCSDISLTVQRRNA